MKIACISPSQIPSSTANSIQVMKVCQSLAQENGEVRLWVPGEKPVGWDQLARQYGLQTRFEITWIPSIRSLRRYDLIWKAFRQAKAWGADLFYTWLPQVSILALRSGARTVLEIHDRPTGRVGRRWFSWYFRQSGQKRTLVISYALRRALEEMYQMQIPEEELVIAPNGVDLERYENLPDPSAARSRLNLPERTTAVYSGHFYAGRGLDILIGLAKSFPQVQFVLVGGRMEAVQSLREQARAEGMDNLCLTGFVDNQVLPLYQAAGDILLMPYERSIAGSSGGNSADICSPMKMFEYMAAGRAIMTSDLPVIREVLDESRAIFCPPEDLLAWKAAFEDLLAEPGRIRLLGERAKQEAAKYSWKSRARRTLGIGSNGFSW